MKKLISNSYDSTPPCVPAGSGTACGRGLRAAALTLGLGCLLTLSAPAATTYWDPQGTSGANPYRGDLSGIWENHSWSASKHGQYYTQAWVENTTAAFGIHTGNGTPPFTVTMNGNHTVAGILNASQAGNNACDVTITGAGTMILPSGNQTFNASNGGDGSLAYIRLNVVLDGTGAVQVQGNGQLSLEAANTYSGGTLLGSAGATWSGKLNFSDGPAFSTGPIVIRQSSGTLVLEGAAAATIANTVVSTNKAFANVLHLAANPAGLTFSGPWNLGATTKLATDGDGNVVVLAGVLSGTGGLAKAGTGTLVLAAANTYTGSTTVSQGTLALAAGGSLSASPVTVVSGATLANTTADATTIGGGSVLDAGAFATFTAVGGVPSVVGTVSVAGDLALNDNALSINVSGDALVLGTYRLLDCSGTVSGAAAPVPTITGTPIASGYTAEVVTTTGLGGHVDLVIKTTAAFSGLAVNPSATYGTTSLTLSGTLGGAGLVYPAVGETVTVTINGNAQIATVIDDLGGFSLSYDASALTVDGSPYPITYSYAGSEALSAATDATTALTVTQAPLTVTANNVTRGYGEANPEFTDTFVGLMNGDAIGATNTCSADQTSVPGQYPIVPSLLDPNNRLGNYAVTLIPGSLTVACPPITVNPSTLPNGVAGTAYSQTLTATGGLGTYTFTVTTGSTPDGLSLSVDGTLSGTPSAAGTNVFTVTATDTYGCGGSQTYSLVVGTVPSITGQPASQTNVVAHTALFTVTAIGSETLSYQWLYNGTNLTDDVRISGSQSNSLSISNLVLEDAGTFTVVVANAFGSVTSSEAVLTVLPPDVTAPTLAITSSISDVVHDATLNLAGTASDDRAVEGVYCMLNGSAWTPAATTDGWATWSASLTLSPGTNVLYVKSQDTSGNLSDISTATVVYIPLALVTVQISGEGTVLPDLNGQLLPVGQTYTLTAQPGVGSLFTGWTGDLAASTPALTFTLQSNVVLQANFVHATLPAKGTFTGLFYETNAVAPASSGKFTLTTTAGRYFSGSLRLAGVWYPLQGRFDTNGTAQVSLPGHKPSPLQLALQLDLTPGSDRIAGTVSDGTWTAQLAGDRAFYDGKKQVAPQAGAYTLVISGSEDQADQPYGYGYGTVSVTKAGHVRLVGTLADGTKVSQGAVVSKYGQWPLYRSLYNRHGLLLSWLNFTNNVGEGLDLQGEVSWLKPGNTSRCYPTGFAVQPMAVGARWVAPAPGTSTLGFTSGTVVLNGGDLSESLASPFELGTKYKVLDLSGNDLRLSFSRTSGAFSGSVVDSVSGQRIPFGGVLLQSLSNGYGCFLGTDTSGQVYLSPRNVVE